MISVLLGSTMYSVILLVIDQLTSPRDLPETMVNLKICNLVAVHDSPPLFAMVIVF